MSIYEGKTRITYYDLDFAGKVKLSAILRIAHIAADVNANQLGIGFSVMMPLNISFVLQRFALKIHQMPKYDQVVTVRTWPAETVRGTFIRKGDMLDEDGNRIMEWCSLWILFDIANRKILKPSALPTAIPDLPDIVVDVSPDKVVPGDVVTFSEHVHTVRYADVDTNMHMNNSIYGDLVGNAAFANGNASQDWAEVQINYLGETRLGDEIKITAGYDSDNNIIVEGNSKGRPSFSAKITRAVSQ